MELQEKSLRRRLLMPCVIMLIFLFFDTATCFAVETEIYRNNAGILENNSFPSLAMRWIGWMITKAIVYIGSGCESLYDTAFGFVDFTSSSVVNAFVTSFKPILTALAAVSLLALGLTLIIKHDKKPELLTNILLFVLCVTCSTLIFSELNGLAKSFKSGVEKDTGGSAIYKVVDNNMVDLVDVGSEDGNKLKSLSKMDYEHRDQTGVNYTNPGITKKNFKDIDYTDVLNYDDDTFNWDADSLEILENQLVILNPKENLYTTTEVYNGFGWNSGDDADLANQFYFRYTFSFISAWLQLFALILIYITMSYKCIRIAFELVVARLLAYLYSAELSGGEKIKKILVFIRDSYILLCITTICIRVYTLLTDYIQDSVDNGLVQGIFSLFIAFAVIDGPNLVERLLGMDAGLKASTGRLLAAYGAAKGLARGGAHAGSAAAGKIFGEKTNAPVPQDGKRHGGIADKVNGTTKDGETIGRQQWEDSLRAAKIKEGEREAERMDEQSRADADSRMNETGNANAEQDEAMRKQAETDGFDDSFMSDTEVSGTASSADDTADSFMREDNPSSENAADTFMREDGHSEHNRGGSGSSRSETSGSSPLSSDGFEQTTHENGNSASRERGGKDTQSTGSQNQERSNPHEDRSRRVEFMDSPSKGGRRKTSAPKRSIRTRSRYFEDNFDLRGDEADGKKHHNAKHRGRK